MNALDVLRRAINFVSGRYSSHSLNKPGAIIQKLSLEERIALEELKSSDIDGGSTSERVEYLEGSEEYYKHKEIEKDKLNFDKKIKL